MTTPRTLLQIPSEGLVDSPNQQAKTLKREVYSPKFIIIRLSQIPDLDGSEIQESRGLGGELRGYIGAYLSPRLTGLLSSQGEKV